MLRNPEKSVSWDFIPSRALLLVPRNYVARLSNSYTLQILALATNFVIHDGHAGGPCWGLSA